jgi:hypothetical protein
MVIAHVATAFNILWEEVRLSLTRHRISASKVRAVGMEPNPRLYSPAWRCVIDRCCQYDNRDAGYSGFHSFMTIRNLAVDTIRGENVRCSPSRPSS